MKKPIEPKLLFCDFLAWTNDYDVAESIRFVFVHWLNFSSNIIYIFHLFSDDNFNQTNTH